MTSGPDPVPESAVLVEDAVVRQQPLSIGLPDFAAGDHRDGVGGDGPAHRTADGFRVSDNGDDPVDLGCQLVENACVRRDEVRSQVQVFGRVAGQREFGEDHELGPRLSRLCDPVGDQRRVAVEVSDRRVDLGQRDAGKTLHTGVLAGKARRAALDRGLRL